MLLDGADPLFQSLDSLLNLTIRELDERTGFSELFVQIGSIVGMTPVEMQLKSFGHELDLMPKSLNENAGVPSDLDDFRPKGFSSNVGVPSGLDDFRPKGFNSNVGVPLCVGNIGPKGFRRSSDNLLNLRERFLIHTPSSKKSHEVYGVGVRKSIDTTRCHNC
jgi:hypothetical protein